MKPAKRRVMGRRWQRRQRFLENQAAKRARQRRKWQRVGYQPGRHLTRNQAEMAKRLTAGQISQVTVSGWGWAAQYLAFMEQLQYWTLLDLDGVGFQRVMVPIARLIVTYQLKILLGIGSMNLVPTKLFREVALLQLIGYTVQELQVGCCQRGHLAAGPMHKNTLAAAMERLTPGELESVLNGVAQRLAAQGFFRTSRGHFALDASAVATTAKYAGAGRKAYVERRVTPQRQVVEVVRVAHGFKVLIVYEVRLRLVVAAKVAPIQQHESQLTQALVRQAITNLGPGVLRVLLIDRGFLDGPTLWQLKQTWGLDFVVPAKDDMRVTADARSLCRQAPDGDYLVQQVRTGQPTGPGQRTESSKVPGQVTVVGVADLRSYDQYGDAAHGKRANRKHFVGNALNAVVVTHWQGIAYPVGEEKVFLTSLPTQQPLDVLDLYDLRSLIENTAFRELKQGWLLEHAPKKSAAAVRAHVLLTLVTFTLANAFRTHLGQQLAQHGIRRQRADAEAPHVFVMAGHLYASFHIEEVCRLLGVVPAISWRADPDDPLLASLPPTLPSAA